MNLNDFENFIEFTKKQIEILKIKEEMYKDAWKWCHSTDLINKMKEQMNKFDGFIETIQSTSKPQPQATVNARDTLLDIANYANFLWQRLGDVNENYNY